MLIESLRRRQRELSILEDRRLRLQEWRSIGHHLGGSRSPLTKNRPPAFGYPAKDQRELAAESTVYEHARAK
jgi:hypothetical protein